MLFAQFHGLSSKIYVAFLITAVLPVTIAGMVSLFYSLEVLKNETLYHLEQEVANQADSIAQFIEQLRSDVLYFGNYSTMLDFVEAIKNHPEPKMAEIRSSLEHDFTVFARTYPYIYQMRFLDNQGFEMVRVERVEGEIKTVSVSELKNKSKHYYVHDLLKVKVGEIIISQMDLNVEQGKVESPEKPIVRFATPVADRKGVVQGIIIINLHADFFLEQKLALARGDITYLFNLSGFYIARRADSAIKTFEMKPVSELNEEFPDTLLQNIMQGKHQTEVIDNRIITYAPVKMNQFLPPLTKWVVVLVYPQRQLFANILNLHILYGLMALCILVAVVAGFYMSRYLLQPLSLLRKETEEVAQGNFSQRVEIKGTDEIADLGQSFNSMAAQLEQKCQCLAQRQIQLEGEVATRTAALEHERQNLATIIENVGEGILSVDSCGYVELANETAALFLELPKDKLIGRRIDECCPHWSQLSWFNKTSQRLELKMAKRTLVINVTPESVMGQLHNCLVLVRDMSEERQRVDHCRELDRQMFQMEKMATMGELAMGLAHEIGNPLAGMKTVIQVSLEEETLTDYLRKNLHRLLNEVNRLSEFLQTFHGFSAPQEMHPVPCRLDEVLEDVLLWTRKEAKSKGINIVYPKDKIPKLWADPSQLKQVLLNVVINAIHMMQNGGEITIGMCIGETCQKGLLRDESHVRFYVRDSGPGIPPNILSHIFEPFFTTREDGSGLGLAVVKKITDQHGASIQVDSQEGQGTRFEFIWPVASGQGQHF
ncbi:MAG: HAMP domain-containing protein [Thiomargarita sp.]|nr:HAMP domain-containing protein [Thiomargarita sp.]